VPVEGAARHAGRRRDIGNPAEGRRVAEEPLHGVRHAGGNPGQRAAEPVEQALRKEDAGLPLKHLPEVTRVVVEPVQDELLEPVPPQLHERAERLGREDRVDDHRERPVPVPDGADPVGLRLGQGVELGVHHQDIHRLAADDGVGVGPVEGGVHAVPVPGRPLEADELIGLDAGRDVHRGLTG